MKKQKEALITGLIILALIFGNIYARDLMDIVWLVVVIGLFSLFFLFVYDKK